MKKLLLGLFLVFLFLVATQIAISLVPPDHTSFRLSSNAVQTIYQNGLPHTDKMGRNLRKFERERSFFPVCLYHTVTGEYNGRKFSFSPIADAGFNCVHTWEGQTLDSVIEDLRANNLQLIYHGTNAFGPSDEELRKYANDPNILGWYLYEEPTGTFWGSDMDGKFATFQKRMEEIKAIDKIHPVFNIDVPLIVPPHTSWWVKWNTIGDVSAHDNYILKPGVTSLSGPMGIAETVSLAVESNKEQKPVWFVVQAFENAGTGDFYWSMPNAREERAMVYSAIIHGATGIIYFSLDNWVTRLGGVVGIAADTVSDYPVNSDSRLITSPMQVNLSRTLWNGVVKLNSELKSLKPIIFSPTSSQKYNVYLQGKSYSDSPIRCILKETNGQLTLITVNLDKRPLWVKYEFPRQPVDLQTLFDNDKKIEVKDNGWIDCYEEFGVHIYQFKLK